MNAITAFLNPAVLYLVTLYSTVLKQQNQNEDL